MSDTDLVKLYSAQILQLAGSIPHLGRLSAPMGSAKLRAPMCGSTIETDVSVIGGNISAFAQDVKACALGQASASILGRVAIGSNREQIQTARDQLSLFLTGGGPAPTPPFGGYEVLRAARDYKNRHGSILLALDAALAALSAAP